MNFSFWKTIIVLVIVSYKLFLIIADKIRTDNIIFYPFYDHFIRWWVDAFFAHLEFKFDYNEMQ